MGPDKITPQAAANSAVLGQTERQPRQGSLLIPENPGLFNLVDKQGKPVPRETLEANRFKNHYHRHQQHRLGSAHRGSFFSKLELTKKSSNYREPYAIFLALEKAKHLLLRSHVQIQLDNATAVAYINKQGGTKNQDLMALTFQIFSFSRGKYLIPLSSASKRGTQPTSRLPQQTDPSPGRMGPEQNNFSKDHETLGETREIYLLQKRIYR